MPTIVFDIDHVRERKSSLLRGDHELLCAQMVVLRGTGQPGKLRVVKAAIERVRRVAAETEVDLGPGPVIVDCRMKLTEADIREIWSWLLAGVESKTIAERKGVTRPLISRIANRVAWTSVTRDLPELPPRGRWLAKGVQHAPDQD
jgi:hypothetical protein